jgi:hypothetical protein
MLKVKLSLTLDNGKTISSSLKIDETGVVLDAAYLVIMDETVEFLTNKINGGNV